MAGDSTLKRVRFFLAAAFVGLIVVLALSLVVKRGQEQSPEAKGPTPEAGTEALAHGITLTEMAGEKVRWKLDAKMAVRQRSASEIFFQGVKMVLFLENGETVELSGPLGNYHRANQDMDIRGGVVVGYSGGYTLKTDSIRYDAKEGLISGDAPLTLFGSGISLKGKSFRFDIEREKISVLGPVWCRIVTRRAVDARGKV